MIPARPFMYERGVHTGLQILGPGPEHPGIWFGVHFTKLVTHFQAREDIPGHTYDCHEPENKRDGHMRVLIE